MPPEENHNESDQQQAQQFFMPSELAGTPSPDEKIIEKTKKAIQELPEKPKTRSFSLSELASLRSKAEAIKTDKTPSPDEVRNLEHSGELLIPFSNSHARANAKEQIETFQAKVSMLQMQREQVEKVEFIGKVEILKIIDRTVELIESGIQIAKFAELKHHQMGIIGSNVALICNACHKALKMAEEKGGAVLGDNAIRILGIIAAQFNNISITCAQDLENFINTVGVNAQTSEEQQILEYALDILKESEKIVHRNQNKNLPSLVALAGNFTEYVGRNMEVKPASSHEEIAPFDTQWAEFMIIKTARNLLEKINILEVDSESLENFVSGAELGLQNLIPSDGERIQAINKKLREYEREVQKLEERNEQRDDHNLANAYKKAKELLAILILTKKEWKKGSDFQFKKKWKVWFSLIETSFRDQPTPTEQESTRQTERILRITAAKADKKPEQSAGEIQAELEDSDDMFGDNWL